MKIPGLCLIAFLFLLPAVVEGQEGEIPRDINANPVSSINFDGRMLAGLNGDSMYSVLMTQGLENFAYQLNSNIIYTNDFEDNDNSSFISNDTGFNGEVTITDYWKMIPEFEVSNSTYGMFDNEYYGRENKDRIKFRIKNEYKPAPARWDLDLSYARFDHKLEESDSAMALPEIDDTFYTSRGTLGMEYVWSASNKAGFRLEGIKNRYPEEFEDDSFASGEFFGSFKVTEYTMLTLAPVFSWHNDGTNESYLDYCYFKGNISSINTRYVTLELLHEYKLVPYEPSSDIYLKKYVSIPYEVPPATVNHSEFNGELYLNFDKGQGDLAGIENFKFRIKGIFEDSDNFYNYYSLPENVLTIVPIEASFINARGELSTSFFITDHRFELEGSYDYFRYMPADKFSDIRITYRPENVFSVNLSYSGPLFEINWENSFNGEVYVNPDSDEKLDSFVVGNLDLHIKLYRTFYIYSRINNIYNEEYSLRDGYPEPGVQFFTGLRIII
ncbi:MAG TPA: hypothetical protein PK358_09390 [Spirochaetota bacterium]|nr:hypothetical protein [Spirochaetota bacterium]